MALNMIPSMIREFTRSSHERLGSLLSPVRQ
jgi:hypothetical protein